MKQMCDDCPFRPEHPYHDGWKAEVVKAFAEESIPTDGTIAVTCHVIDRHSSTTKKSEEMCAGHLEFLKVNLPVPNGEE